MRVRRGSRIRANPVLLRRSVGTLVHHLDRADGRAAATWRRVVLVDGDRARALLPLVGGFIRRTRSKTARSRDLPPRARRPAAKVVAGERVTDGVRAFTGATEKPCPC